MRAPQQAVDVAMTVLGCERVEYRYRGQWACLKHYARQWTPRGCPVAANVADALLRQAGWTEYLRTNRERIHDEVEQTISELPTRGDAS